MGEKILRENGKKMIGLSLTGMGGLKRGGGERGEEREREGGREIERGEGEGETDGDICINK